MDKDQLRAEIGVITTILVAGAVVGATTRGTPGIPTDRIVESFADIAVLIVKAAEARAEEVDEGRSTAP